MGAKVSLEWDDQREGWTPNPLPPWQIFLAGLVVGLAVMYLILTP